MANESKRIWGGSIAADSGWLMSMKKNTTKKFKSNALISISLGVIGLIITMGSYWIYSGKYATMLEKLAISESMSSLTQSISKNAFRVATESRAVIESLDDDEAAFSEKLFALRPRGRELTFSYETKESLAALKAVESNWENAQNVLKRKSSVNTYKSNIASATSDLDKLIVEYNAFLQLDMTPKQKEVVQYSSDRAKRIQVNTSELQNQPQIAKELEFQVMKDLIAIRQGIKSLEFGNVEDDVTPLTSPNLKLALAGLKKAFMSGGMEIRILTWYRSINEIQNAKDFASDTYKMSENLNSSVKKLTEEHQKINNSLVSWQLGSLLGVLVMLSGLAYFFYSLNRSDKQKARESRAENDRNLAAVRQLLGEIQGVGKGDLTRKATIGNGVTNEIAVSLNATVGELRKLVGRVRNTVFKVTDLAGETDKIAGKIATYASQQEEKIDIAATDITKISQELDEVAQQTSYSSEVASDTVKLSEAGGLVVKNTIEGMNNIRDTIQESAKRIKSLGESSQEIGRVTQIIQGVGSKIQVLALNAAIQAASAGEAGKGFSVVAEEVQVLADEAAEAAQKIDRLVQNIQGSSKEAIATMEQTTARVVEGAKTADEAGESLRKIGLGSEKLKGVVESVTEKMQEKSESATDLAFGMRGIKNLTKVSRDQSEEAQKVVAKMIAATKELQDSVADFRLDA